MKHDDVLETAVTAASILAGCVFAAALAYAAVAGWALWRERKEE